MPTFEDILTPEIKAASVTTKNLEWVIPHPEVLKAVELATEADVAVLGAELFEIVDDGFLVKNYSGYEITDNGNWKEYVSRCNTAAALWVKEHQIDGKHGFILTAVSEAENLGLASPK